ncbi:hypothetical protein GCK72_003275 [Caenorhabditis remanei]|uniref:VWFA domain-containing protein n=1 Tax=Caenorhabditis remanei TaxID=31234 RepID=A0A6A5HUJ9_CAERE|nr:hypothetical protein GCK72_003275 [Caenorhabditis remanei]KAF1771449.1 hypothetical protein GCK72_003275 [Caenorhabditis remanei]
MKLHIVLSVLAAAVYADSYSPLSYMDRLCGTDLSNLWLDVVLVVDNSEEMGSQRLGDITTNILSVFGANTRIGSTSSEPRTTRVGFVTFNAAGSLYADLNQFQSFSDLRNGVTSLLKVPANTKDSYLATGLSMAAQLLTMQGFDGKRDHYQKVVIVYASKYGGTGDLDPQPTADRLKGSGVKIITVAYGDEALLESLSTPRFGFNSASGYPQIQGALLESNCYCPLDWIQYRSDYTDRASFPYGVCIRPVPIPASWLGAKMSCSHRWNNSNLATEFNQAKHNFILEAVKDTRGVSPPYQYHIGLNYASGSWVWTQSTGRQQVPLQQPFMWSSGYPQLASDKSRVMSVQSGLGTGWQNIATTTLSANYVCEAYSCDTDNYCDGDQRY